MMTRGQRKLCATVGLKQGPLGLKLDTLITGPLGHKRCSVCISGILMPVLCAEYSVYFAAKQQVPVVFIETQAPPKTAPLHGEASGPHLIHDFLGPSESTCQTPSRLSHPCLLGSRFTVLRLCNGRPLPTPIRHMVPWVHSSPNAKPHLDRFSRFLRGAWLCPSDRQPTML